MSAWVSLGAVTRRAPRGAALFAGSVALRETARRARQWVRTWKWHVREADGGGSPGPSHVGRRRRDELAAVSPGGPAGVHTRRGCGVARRWRRSPRGAARRLAGDRPAVRADRADPPV